MHAVVVLGHALEAHADREVDLALAEGTLEGLAHGLVLVGDQVRQGLDDRHLGAEGGPHARELAADDAAAEHDDGGRHVVEVERLVGGHHATADLQARERAGVGAGGQHDMLAGVPLAVHLDGVRADEAAVALDEGDRVGLHQALQALVEAGDDAVLVGVHGGHVDALERGAHAVLLALAGRVGDLGRVQQGLGRDAAVVQAGPADLAGLDQGHGQSELRGAQGSGVSAAPSTQDHDVEDGVRHGQAPLGHGSGSGAPAILSSPARARVPERR